MGDPWKRKEVIGPHILYLANNEDVMPKLDVVDHVFTDPPYGIASTHANHLSKVKLRDGSPAGQALGFDGITGDKLVGLATQWCAVAKRWVVFSCDWKDAHRIDDAGLLVRLGIWRKPDGAPQFTGDRPGMGWEAIAICHRKSRKRWNGGGKHGVWTAPKGCGDGHPTQKPVQLLCHWVNDFTDYGETVLDPFMGSGTTIVACERLGRKGVGIEIDEGHFDLACKRVEEEYRQPNMLVEPPKPSIQEGFDI